MVKKSKNKTKTVINKYYINPYEIDFYVVVGPDRTEFYDMIDPENNEDLRFFFEEQEISSKSASTFRISENGDETIAVLFYEAPPAPLAAHEAMHVVHYVWQIIGHSPSLEQDEPDAYLMGHIMDLIERSCKGFKQFEYIEKQSSVTLRKLL